MNTPKMHHTIETFIEATNIEINEEIARVKPPIYSNLLKEEQKALEGLQERDDIAIVKADKGGTVFLMNVTDYIEKSERQILRSIILNNQKIKLHQTMKQSTVL